jgi:hypothetical protein
MLQASFIDLKTLKYPFIHCNFLRNDCNFSRNVWMSFKLMRYLILFINHIKLNIFVVARNGVR